MVEARVAQLTGTYARQRPRSGRRRAACRGAGRRAGVRPGTPIRHRRPPGHRGGHPARGRHARRRAGRRDRGGLPRPAGLDGRAARRVGALLLAVRRWTGRPEPTPAVLAGQLAAPCGLVGGTPGLHQRLRVGEHARWPTLPRMIRRGDVERVVVAAGYLVEPDQFALFDAGRALAARRGGPPVQHRPPRAAAGRRRGRGGAGVEHRPKTRRRSGGRPWPVGAGPVTRSIPASRSPAAAGWPARSAARCAGPGCHREAVGYVNANATGTAQSDAAEAAALSRALGGHATQVPVSSTKSVHGHALEASGLLELVVTALALRHGELPINAGWLGPDPDCPLNVVTDRPRTTNAHRTPSPSTPPSAAPTPLSWSASHDRLTPAPRSCTSAPTITAQTPRRQPLQDRRRSGLGLVA